MLKLKKIDISLFEIIITGIVLGSVLNQKCWAMTEEFFSLQSHGIPSQISNAQDPLFPKDLSVKNNIRRGLELVMRPDKDFPKEETKRLLCNTDWLGESTEPVPIDGKKKDPISDAKLFLTAGSEKKAIKLDQNSEKIILIGAENANEECQAYKILNAFGLISQQDPEVVTVVFNNTTMENVLCVSNFEFLARKSTDRRTFDIKNLIGYGDISIFHDEINYKDVKYHRRLLSPLVKDITLWHLMGRPAVIEFDALNLIFKQTKEKQTVCRLLIYDIYASGNTKDVFERLKKTYDKINSMSQDIEILAKDITNKPYESSISTLYKFIYRAMTPKEKVKLWGGTEEDWSHPWNTQWQDENSMWNMLEPLIIEDCKEEIKRISTSFQEVIAEIDHT